MRPDQNASHNSPDHAYTQVDLTTLQGFYNREQAAVEYSRMHARYGNHLLSQVNFWKQAFTNLQAAYVQLQTDHTALLTRYELAVSHNVDVGPIIMENIMLKRRLTHLEYLEGRFQHENTQFTQARGFASAGNTTPIDEDSEFSDDGDYGPEDYRHGEAY